MTQVSARSSPCSRRCSAAPCCSRRPHRRPTVSTTLRSGISGLPVATEVRTGYARDMFPLWIDADGDGCNTRYEVLIAEATTKPTIGSGCTLTGGRWYSYYDGLLDAPSDLDIDHLVPLAEAWDSGARTWTAAQRAGVRERPRRCAATWSRSPTTSTRPRATRTRPTGCRRTGQRRCRYVAEWTAVKIRWRLTVDTAEKSALIQYAAGCTNVTITVAQAI